MDRAPMKTRRTLFRTQSELSKNFRSSQSLAGVAGLLNPTKLTMSTALNNYGVLGESRPKGMLASNSLVCIASELPVIRAQSDGMPPLAVRRFGRIVLSQCAAARVLLDKRRHKYERQ
jgi:hypothetical protein